MFSANVNVNYGLLNINDNSVNILDNRQIKKTFYMPFFKFHFTPKRKEDLFCTLKKKCGIMSFEASSRISG